jgi:hypothetical protein
MFKAAGSVVLAVAVCLGAAGLTACGSSGNTRAANSVTASTASAPVEGASAQTRTTTAAAGIPADAVAKVGEQPITKAFLGHWMSVLAAQDFYEVFGVILPRRLVFKPPTDSVCVADLEAIRMQYARKHPISRVRPNLRTSCRQLDLALREQALRFLIQYLWSVGQDAEQGIRINGADVEQEFKKVRGEEFSTEAALRQHLMRRKMTFDDEIYEIRRNVLNNKLKEKFSKMGGQEAESRYIVKVTPKWTALTDCRTGYVVQECKQYRTAPSSPAPDVLIEQLLQSPPSSSK